MSATRIANGTAVIVRTLIGAEPAIVTGSTHAALGEQITYSVIFADRTRSTWPASQVEIARNMPERIAARRVLTDALVRWSVDPAPCLAALETLVDFDAAADAIGEPDALSALAIDAHCDIEGYGLGDGSRSADEALASIGAFLDCYEGIR